MIEIGAGAGTNAAAMAKRGASVTLLDYSPKALGKARELFEANGLEADFVEANALELPDEVRGGFDVAMSFGLNEHFTGAERDGIFQAHLDALRDGGIAIVSVPNARNAPYRASKWLAERTGRWKLGVEVPFTRAGARGDLRAPRGDRAGVLRRLLRLLAAVRQPGPLRTAGPRQAQHPGEAAPGARHAARRALELRDRRRDAPSLLDFRST